MNIIEFIRDPQLIDGDLSPAQETALRHAYGLSLDEQQQVIAVPLRFSQFIRDVWQLQERLESRLPRSIERIAGHARFRAAYDFLLLRAETGEQLAELADWWTRYQDVSADARRSMIDELHATQPKRKRRRRRGRRRRDSAATDAGLS